MQSHRAYLEGISYPDALKDVPTPKEAPFIIGPPIKGINTYSKPVDIDNNESSLCYDARVVRGWIEPRPGIELLHEFTDETVMYMKEFTTSTGAYYFLVLTTKSIYYTTNYSSYTRIPWYYTTGTATTNGTTTVTGTGTLWLTNARAGDRFKIDSIGTWATIASVDSNTQLTLTSAYPSASGAAYHIDRYFGGDTDNTFWSVIDAYNDRFIFSQGIDNILYATLPFDTLYIFNSSYASNFGTIYADRLFIGSVRESPMSSPFDYAYRLRWSVAGNYSDFSGSGSGYKDCSEDPYDITGLAVISDTLLIYKTYSIMHATRTGSASNPFDFKVRVDSIGCYIPGTLVSIGDAHFFVGSDNFYTYDLRSPKAVGDKVKDAFLDELNPTYAHRTHALVAEEFNEIQIYYPDTSSSTPNRCLVYNYDLLAFTSKWRISSLASGYGKQYSSDTWDSSPGTYTWDTWTGSWDSSDLLANKPINLIANGANLYKQSTALTDAGTSFTLEWRTKELALIELQKRILLCRVRIAYYTQTSGDILVSISGDGGASWETDRTCSLQTASTSQLKYAVADFLGTYNSIIVRVRSTSVRYKIVRIILELTAAGEI
jgi:hypothetical protein